MIINDLSAQNYKTFNELQLSLRKLNIVIGSNASGKSNLISMLNFIKNIQESSLDNAISMEGGMEYVRNRRLENSKNLSIKIGYETGIRIGLSRAEHLGMKFSSETYEFSLQTLKTRSSYKVLKDELCLNYEFHELDSGENKRLKEGKLVGKGKAVVSVQNGKISFDQELPQEFKKYSAQFLPQFPKRSQLDSGEILLGSPFFFIAHEFRNPISDIAMYDLDPKQPKRAVSISGKNELDKNGSNIAIVLRNIIRDKENKRKFLNLINDLLPFVADLKVQNFADKSLIFTVNEKYMGRSDILPASVISDGTINIVGIIIALYFERRGTIVIEEPERNIHPKLISKLVGMFKEVSEKKQIIVTTHNPELVRHSSVDDLVLMSRDQVGFSKVARPGDSKEVMTFLENDIGMDELYVQNLWGG